MRCAFLLVMTVSACGSVSVATDSGTGDDGSVAMDGGSDGAVDAMGTPDADPCAQFVAPAGSSLLHDQLCAEALGYNPNANPVTMTLACPGSGSTAGTYGLIRRPSTAQQADGCTAMSNVTRITAPAVTSALTEVATGHTLAVTAGDRLRVRVACAAQSAGNCRGKIQITGRLNPNANVVLVYPSAGFHLVQGQDVVDVDVPLPSTLVGTTTKLHFIVSYDGVDVPDLLFVNPHLH